MVRRRLRCSLMSWLSNGLFWAVLLGALALSVGSKSFINLAIEPITFNVSVRSLEGQIYPFPPGRLGITHSQHWASSGPANLFAIGWAFIVVYLFLAMTRRVLHHRIAYVGVGLFLAGVISNRGEVGVGLFLAGVISNRGSFRRDCPGRSRPFRACHGFPVNMANRIQGAWGDNQFCRLNGCGGIGAVFALVSDLQVARENPKSKGGCGSTQSLNPGRGPALSLTRLPNFPFPGSLWEGWPPCLSKAPAGPLR